MINVEQFVRKLQIEGIEFFAGVPDSFLNAFCTYIQNNIDKKHHIIAANEGNAIALAAGYYIASGNMPLVYMQNSGMGNALNPLVSLADKNVYSIPMILLIGWRGEPGIGDHAQHKIQGRITKKLLEDMEISYKVLSEEMDAEQCIEWCIRTAKDNSCPAALIIRKNVFSGDKKKIVDDSYPLRREEAIKIVLDYMPEDTVYVATTGRATRELYNLREERRESHEYDFLNVGSMGHAASVAAGLALAKQQRRIVCLDGDSAVIMHMGSLATVKKEDIPNLMHIVLNNGAHESVGGQPSVGHGINFTGIAKSCGYETIKKEVTTKEELIQAMRTLEKSSKASFIDVRICMGVRDHLGPLNINLQEELKMLRTELREEKYV